MMKMVSRVWEDSLEEEMVEDDSQEEEVEAVSDCYSDNEDEVVHSDRIGILPSLPVQLRSIFTAKQRTPVLSGNLKNFLEFEKKMSSTVGDQQFSKKHENTGQSDTEDISSSSEPEKKWSTSVDIQDYSKVNEKDSIYNCNLNSHPKITSCPHNISENTNNQEKYPIQSKLKDHYSEPNIYHNSIIGSNAISKVSMENNTQRSNGIFEHCESTFSNSLFDFGKITDERFEKITNSETSNNGNKLYSDDENEKTTIEKKKYFIDINLKVRKNKKIVDSKIISIKSVSHCSTENQTIHNQSVQTTNNFIYKEKCIGPDEKMKISNKSKGVNTETTNPLNIEVAMNYIKSYVNNIISKDDNNYGEGFPMSIDSILNSNKCSLKNPFIYSENNADKLHLEIKQIHSLLESKINSKKIDRQQVKHKRCYSENVKNISFLGSGDFVNDHDIDINKDALLTSKKVNFSSNSASVCTRMSEESNCIRRTFELNPYDDLIKSYMALRDRRIKAVAHKMKCNILICGPIRIFDSTSCCWNSRNKTAYRCTITGTTKDAVDKCLRCLQDTFPLSHLNEKLLYCKFENGTYV